MNEITYIFEYMKRSLAIPAFFSTAVDQFLVLEEWNIRRQHPTTCLDSSSTGKTA
jgi:hypothetical protein